MPNLSESSFFVLYMLHLTFTFTFYWVDDEEATKEEDQDVRLCAALRGLLGGSKYVKQSELSREVLLKLCHPKWGRCSCHPVHGDSRAFSGWHI